MKSDTGFLRQDMVILHWSNFGITVYMRGIALFTKLDLNKLKLNGIKRNVDTTENFRKTKLSPSKMLITVLLESH